MKLVEVVTHSILALDLVCIGWMVHVEDGVLVRIAVWLAAVLQAVFGVVDGVGESRRTTGFDTCLVIGRRMIIWPRVRLLIGTHGLGSWVGLRMVSLLVVDLVDEAADVYGVLEGASFVRAESSRAVETPLSIEVVTVAREGRRCVQSRSNVCCLILAVVVVLNLTALLRCLRERAWEWIACIVSIRLRP